MWTGTQARNGFCSPVSQIRMVGIRGLCMHSRSLDEDEYRLLSLPQADVQVRLARCEAGEPEIEVFGNRMGLLALANVLLWLLAHAWRREFLSLAELPFVHVQPPLSLYIRLTLEDQPGWHGLLKRTDNADQFEW